MTGMASMAVGRQARHWSSSRELTYKYKAGRATAHDVSFGNLSAYLVGGVTHLLFPLKQFHPLESEKSNV